MAASAVREAIELFKMWSKGKIRDSSIKRNANKMAKVKPLFVGFVTEHKRFWEERFEYVVGKTQGQDKSSLVLPWRRRLFESAASG